MILSAAAFRNAVFIKAALTALIVGSVLLVINQYGALFGEDDLRLIPAVLTYCVPFAVFIFGKMSK